MQFLIDLWVPIVVAGVALWVVSAIIWMALPTHKTEFGKLPNEDAVLAALRASGAPPGLYALPHMGVNGSEMRTPEGQAKMKQGPLAHIKLGAGGMPAMGPMMAKSFLSSLIVAFFAAYVGWHAMIPGALSLHVFRIIGTVVFMTYSIGSIPDSIWFMRPWKSFWLQCVDAAMYAVTAGAVFAWLWPTGN